MDFTSEISDILKSETKVKKDAKSDNDYLTTQDINNADTPVEADLFDHASHF